MIKEEWRSVRGFEDLYEVSNFGRVRSLDRVVRNRGGMAHKSGRMLSQKTTKSGYKAVNLWKDNKGSMYLVHRLVAIAFLENPLELKEVNHKDENTANNHVGNLEWCDRKYNANYGTGRWRAAAKMRGRSFNEKPVDQYDLDGNLIGHYKSATVAAEAVGGSLSSICYCARGIHETCYGYIWKWANG